MVLCPLCSNISNLILSQQNVNWKIYHRTGQSLDFYQCDVCRLSFKDRKFALDLNSQKERYLEHQNEISEGYTTFLNKLWEPLSQYVLRDQRGLDYGCGPTKALESLARQDGYHVVSYDPIFWNHENTLKLKYDYVFCSEVVEHFIDAHEEWKKLKSLLRKGGILGVMTSFVPNNFESWHYHRDPTHISFYTPATFKHIAQQFGFRILRCQDSVVIMVAL